MTGIVTNKGLQIVAVIVLCLLAAVFLAQTFSRANRDIGYDFTSYLLSAQALAHGENPYETGSVFKYIYPLFLAFALIPLTALPYSVAVPLWYLIAVGSLIWSVRIIVGLAADGQGLAWGRRLLIPLCGMTVLLIPVIQSNLLNGQVNFLVLLLCTLFLKFHVENRTLPAAAMLALAIAIKIFPAILLLFVLFQKRYREVVLTAGFAVALCLLPAALMGREGLGVIQWYLQSVLLGMHAGIAMSSAERLFFNLSGVISRVVPGLAWTVWLQLASTAIVVSAIVVIQQLLRPWTQKNKATVLFSLYLLAILLISPLSETHHLTFMIPAAIFLILWPIPIPNASRQMCILVPTAFFTLFWLGKLTDSGFFFFSAVIFAIVVLVRMTTASQAHRA
jgi:hypothetical protein